MPATPTDRLYGLTTSVAVKPPVSAISDSNIVTFGLQTVSYTSTTTGTHSVDLADGMRVLLISQTDSRDNGIWLAKRSFWVRAPDFDGQRDAVNGTLVLSVFGDFWKCNADDPVVIGTTPMNFESWLTGVIDDSLISVKQPFSGSVIRTQHDKNAESITPMDSGAVGDGVTNDQAAFTVLEAMPAGTQVDLLGKTYLISTLPTIHEYFNGYLKTSGDGYIYSATPEEYINVGDKNVIIGNGAGASMPKWVKYKQAGHPYNVFAIGWEALGKNLSGRNMTAIGSGALHELVNGRYNIAIGLESQYYCNSNDGAVLAGTRNTSLGDNSLRFNVTGYSNCAMGRNTGQNIVNVNFNTTIGAASMSGYSPLALDGVTIENQSPITAGEQTHVGTNSGFWSNSVGNTSFGCDAAGGIKTGQIVAMGHQAGMSIEIDRHYNGKQKLFVSLSGTYSWVSGTITCTVAGHGLTTGFFVKAVIGGREANYLSVAVTDVNTFTITTPYLNTESGAISISEVVTLTALTPVTGIIAIGRRTMASANNCQNSVAIGETSQFQSNGTNNTSVGGLTFNANTTGSFGVAIGYSSLRFNTTGGQNTAIGEFSASNNTTGSRITAVGRNSLRNNQAGSPMDGFDNVAGLGADARVSGSNQVQLGDAATTTYVYGTVQNRSDMNDKADVRDTVLGIDFIMGLRPVDGRWDMRDDYFETLPEKPVEPLAPTKPVAPIMEASAQGVRVYHLDGDETNIYSRVIETGRSDYIETSEQYQARVDVYNESLARYNIELAGYPAEVENYEKAIVEWDFECSRIREHNSAVATGEGKDGSKTRERFHHWFIAQEVKELCDNLGVEFGGYQDHKIAGGCDVHSLGYDEFIPPAVKAIQQCWQRINELERRVANLEGE